MLPRGLCNAHRRTRSASDLYFLKANLDFNFIVWLLSETIWNRPRSAQHDARQERCAPISISRRAYIRRREQDTKRSLRKI